MKTNKQNADFLYIGVKLLKWFSVHGRDLPFRKAQDPYKIWICEIIFQQTRIQQGLNHYHRFINRFPDVQTLAEASSDEVLLHWKGLGYYSRALNIHKASHQIMENFGGVFPQEYDDILSLKGVGKYTAAAVHSICFGGQLPAVDGNFYRVLSRIFADDYDISTTGAFSHFSNVALLMMPLGKAGEFNQAVMDLGSEICRPRNPYCEICPLNADCTAFQLKKVHEFPKKLKKIKPTELQLLYVFVQHGDHFLIRRRNESSIWKKLYEFPTEIDEKYKTYELDSTEIKHKLTHRNLTVIIRHFIIKSQEEFETLAAEGGFYIVDYEQSAAKSFPKPLENYLKNRFEK